MILIKKKSVRSSKAQLLPPQTGGKSCALDKRSCTHAHNTQIPNRTLTVHYSGSTTIFRRDNFPMRQYSEIPDRDKIPMRQNSDETKFRNMRRQQNSDATKFRNLFLLIFLTFHKISRRKIFFSIK